LELAIDYITVKQLHLVTYRQALTETMSSVWR